MELKKTQVSIEICNHFSEWEGVSEHDAAVLRHDYRRALLRVQDLRPGDDRRYRRGYHGAIPGILFLSVLDDISWPIVEQTYIIMSGPNRLVGNIYI